MNWSGPSAGAVPSLAEELLALGFPAVLGWGRPVLDAEATAAAAALYDRLAAGFSPAEALLHAHAALDRLKAKHWHLLRLFVYGNANSPPGLNDQALNRPAEVRSDLVERVQDLADFHGWLGAPAGPAGSAPETWLIYGTGRDTETRIAFAAGGPQSTVTQEGDGTVPGISATALALAPDRQFAVTSLEHAVACQDVRVRELSSGAFR